tara:strand:+ start:657 stop:1025 length:369 start_codon:yes stop_codon:yes gene_type:complete
MAGHFVRMSAASPDCEFDFCAVCARSANIAVFVQFPLLQCSTETGHPYWPQRVGNDQLTRNRQSGHAEVYPDWIRTQQLRDPFHAPKKVMQIYRKTTNLHAVPHIKAVVIAACHSMAALSSV